MERRGNERKRDGRRGGREKWNGVEEGKGRQECQWTKEKASRHCVKVKPKTMINDPWASKPLERSIEMVE